MKGAKDKVIVTMICMAIIMLICGYQCGMFYGLDHSQAESLHRSKWLVGASVIIFIVQISWLLVRHYLII